MKPDRFVKYSKQAGMVNLWDGCGIVQPERVGGDFLEAEAHAVPRSGGGNIEQVINSTSDGIDQKRRLALFYAQEGEVSAFEGVLSELAVSMGAQVIRQIVVRELRPLRLVRLHIALKKLQLLNLSDEKIAEECGCTVRSVVGNRKKMEELLPPVTQNFGV